MFKEDVIKDNKYEGETVNEMTRKENNDDRNLVSVQY